MRRWAGPGEPYPHSRAATINRPSPDATTPGAPLREAIESNGHLVEQMSEVEIRLLDRLRLMRRKNNGEYKIENMHLKHKYDGASEAHECIRMASAPICISAARNLHLFFGVNVSDFRPQDLVDIA